jgi:predicted CoA-substrate-specific enzyme activase
MSITAGVDIGSTASKALILVDGTVAGYVVGPSSTNPARTAREIYRQALEKAGRSASEVSYIVGTGYGRTRVEFADKNISEITCHGRGAHFLRPSTRTVIDIGGQDTKVICIDAAGNLLDFVMNDKCAAGTGRFLEAMARSMEIPIEEMERYYFGEGDPCTITSMCSVFAESEVINLINDGVALPGIVKGLLLSLANRVSSLARRLGMEEEVVMTGGVAKNRGVRDALEKKLGIVLNGFDGMDPQIVGALGAALIAADLASGTRAEP